MENEKRFPSNVNPPAIGYMPAMNPDVVQGRATVGSQRNGLRRRVWVKRVRVICEAIHVFTQRFTKFFQPTFYNRNLAYIQHIAQLRPSFIANRARTHAVTGVLSLASQPSVIYSAAQLLKAASKSIFIKLFELILF